VYFISDRRLLRNGSAHGQLSVLGGSGLQSSIVRAAAPPGVIHAKGRVKAIPG
jgi:hypothetical protein